MYGIANLSLCEDCGKCIMTPRISEIWYSGGTIRIKLKREKGDDNMSSGIKDSVFASVDEKVKRVSKGEVDMPIPDLIKVSDDEAERVKIPAGWYMRDSRSGRNDHYLSYVPAYRLPWTVAEDMLGRGHKMTRECWNPRLCVVTIAPEDYSIHIPIIKGLVLPRCSVMLLVTDRGMESSMEQWSPSEDDLKATDWMYRP